MEHFVYIKKNLRNIKIIEIIKFLTSIRNIYIRIEIEFVENEVISLFLFHQIIYNLKNIFEQTFLHSKICSRISLLFYFTNKEIQ